MDKRELRNYIKGVSSSKDKDYLLQASELIIDKLENESSFKNSGSVLVYWSLPSEVFTHDAVERWSENKKVYLPVINGNELDVVPYEGLSALAKEKSFGILEPTSTTKVSIESIDIVIVPGVAFDSNCSRLGKGKGFYDRLLSGVNTLKVGICFDYQLVDEVPVEPFDIVMDMVITESQIVKGRKM